MKKLSVLVTFLLVLAAGLSSGAWADSSASFTVSGAYSNDTINSTLTAPGQNFSINFSLPMDPTSLMQDYVPGDDFYLNPISATYTYNGSSTILNNVLLSFYVPIASTQYGGFFIDYCATDPTCVSGLDYQWTFSGPQQYTGGESNPILVPTNFSYSGQPFDILNDANPECYSSISGSVSTSVMATPEPSALVLLVAGLGALLLFVKFRG
jgi:hypothetical protein